MSKKMASEAVKTIKFARMSGKKAVEVIEIPENRQLSEYIPAAHLDKYQPVTADAVTGAKKDDQTGEWTLPAPRPKRQRPGTLTVDKWVVEADGHDTVSLTYAARDTVCVIIGNELKLVEPVNGLATIGITADVPGPIPVYVRDKSIMLAAVPKNGPK